MIEMSMGSAEKEAGLLKRHTPDAIYEVIAGNEGLFLLNFSLPSIHICAHLRADLERLSVPFESAVDMGEVQLPPDSELIQEFELTSIPTLLLFQDSAEIERVEQFWTFRALEDYLYLVTAFYSNEDDQEPPRRLG